MRLTKEIRHARSDAGTYAACSAWAKARIRRSSGSALHRLCAIVLAPFLMLSLMLMPLPSSAAQSVTAHSNISLTATHWDFLASQKVTTMHTVAWSSDVAWEITVKSLDADLGTSNGYTKPLSDLEWKTSPVGSWTTMTTTDATVKTGAAGSGDFDLDYKIWLSWSSDVPGTYGCTLQFTISAQ